MSRYAIAAAALVVILAFVAPAAANAHKPLEVEAPNGDFESAKLIPDHRVSWAVYEELGGSAPASAADYYKFEAREGERFYAQVTIPKLDQLADFTPSLAIVGNGIGQADVELGGSILVQDTTFPAPDGMDAIVIDYDGPLPSTEFYEPFTQTSYWERQEILIPSLPTSGTYYIAVFDDGTGQQQKSKYTLAVGEIEDFGAADLFTTLPAAWFSTKTFFGDYLSVAAVIAALAATVGLGVVYTLRRAAMPSLSLQRQKE